jgi:hypothetical protein
VPDKKKKKNSRKKKGYKKKLGILGLGLPTQI